MLYKAFAPSTFHNRTFILLLSLSGAITLGFNGVEAFLYCQLEVAVGDETVTLARQQSTDIFFFSKVNVVPHKTMRIMLQCFVPSFVQ